MSENSPHNPDAAESVESDVVTAEEAATQADHPAGSVAEETAVAGEVAPDAESDLATQLAEAERQRDDYLDSWKRAAADFQNFKKREEKMRIERERAANSRLLTRLLPVLDDLQRGAQHVPDGWEENDWTRGMLAIERKLWTLLEQEGVTVIEASPGTELDPHVHEALITLPNDEVESGQIVDELERGYRLRDLVLRPARVAVAQ